MTVEITLLIWIVILLAGILILNCIRLRLAMEQSRKVDGLEKSQTAQRDAWIDMCNGLRELGDNGFAEKEGDGNTKPEYNPRLPF